MILFLCVLFCSSCMIYSFINVRFLIKELKRILFYDRDYVEIEFLHSDVKPPRYKTDGAACADIHAYLENDLLLEPGSVYKVPTGFRVNIPYGYEILLRPRSGLSLNGITLSNCVGTIDSDFTGELMVLLTNHSKQAFTVTNGMRVAQMTLKKVRRITFHQVSRLSRSTTRGGFGSTGE